MAVISSMVRVSSWESSSRLRMRLRSCQRQSFHWLRVEPGKALTRKASERGLMGNLLMSRLGLRTRVELPA